MCIRDSNKKCRVIRIQFGIFAECSQFIPITHNPAVCVRAKCGNVIFFCANYVTCLLYTSNGIYGGKLDANEWEKKIDGKELYYCKDFPSPVLGIANMVKVPGRDLEFYMMTWKNAECSDFEWVHYFAGKKP